MCIFRCSAMSDELKVLSQMSQDISSAMQCFAFLCFLNDFNKKYFFPQFSSSQTNSMSGCVESSSFICWPKERRSFRSVCTLVCSRRSSWVLKFLEQKPQSNKISENQISKIFLASNLTECKVILVCCLWKKLQKF